MKSPVGTVHVCARAGRARPSARSAPLAGEQGSETRRTVATSNGGASGARRRSNAIRLATSGTRAALGIESAQSWRDAIDDAAGGAVDEGPERHLSGSATANSTRSGAVLRLLHEDQNTAIGKGRRGADLATVSRGRDEAARLAAGKTSMTIGTELRSASAQPAQAQEGHSRPTRPGEGRGQWHAFIRGLPVALFF